MLSKPFCVKRYHAAHQRFLKPLIISFFRSAFPKLFGPVICDKLADELLVLFERTCPPVDRLKPGQVLWVALDKNTRGDSPHRKFVPVILSLVTPHDITQLVNGVKPSVIAKDTIARIIREAYNQGGILSTRDVALLTLRNDSTVSVIRSRYEQEHECVLPHTGALHDMGTTITHKRIIVSKVMRNKKDPATVARECHHSQPAVDRYLKDYHRVNTLFELNHDITFISRVTGIAPHVVKQYLDLINNEKQQRSKN
jgi:hypothetical protein